MLGITFDRRLLLPALPYFLVIFPAAVWPHNIYWFFAITNTVTMALILWQWWPDESRCGDSSHQ